MDDFRKIVAALLISGFLIGLTGCPGKAGKSGSNSSGVRKQVPIPNGDLAAERSGFDTRLHSLGPAPQQYKTASPPAGVREVIYHSGKLELKAWLSEDPGDGVKRPAVVYLHGGWAFAPVDWEDASPFVKAGYVVLMPMLRGENGNPGHYQGFYGEVDDAVAAGEFVASLPYVDENNVFVAGHSVGAVLTVLASMVPSNFRAAAALSGYLDMQDWVIDEHPALVIFDATNPEEIRLRDPMSFAHSLKIPIILYSERGGMDRINEDFWHLAKRHKKECELRIVNGDHQSMVAPSVEHAIDWFRKRIKKP